MTLTVNASLIRTDYPYIESSLVTACCDWMQAHFRADSQRFCKPGVGLSLANDESVEWMILGCDGESAPIRFCPGCGEALPVGQVPVKEEA